MAACDILETFEDVVGNWSVTVDESGTGSVTRSSTYARKTIEIETDVAGAV